VKVNRETEPSYGGAQTFEKVPLVLETSDLDGVDVAIVGAPTDNLVSNRPGTRFGPRAIRSAYEGGGSPQRWHLDLGVDPFADLTIVDFADAGVVSGDGEATLLAIERSVAEIAGAGAVPIILGGDHAIAYPDIKAIAGAKENGSIAVVQFDTHADTATDVWGVKYSHGSPFRHLVDEGILPGERLIQIGLRGYWPFPEEFAWARENGVRWHRMEEVRRDGLDAVVDRIRAEIAGAEYVFLSVDVDVLDPAFAPGTGTPCSGGMTTYELLSAIRSLALENDLTGAEVVEVSPPYDHADITAIAAHDVVLEILSCIAVRRRGGAISPEDP
jgi:agmatinase